MLQNYWRKFILTAYIKIISTTRNKQTRRRQHITRFKKIKCFFEFFSIFLWPSFLFQFRVVYYHLVGDVWMRFCAIVYQCDKCVHLLLP